jgi:hypothetical protein
MKKDSTNVVRGQEIVGSNQRSAVSYQTLQGCENIVTNHPKSPKKVEILHICFEILSKLLSAAAYSLNPSFAKEGETHVIN